MSSSPASATAARVSPAALSVLVPRRGLCPCAIDGAKVAVAVSPLVDKQGGGGGGAVHPLCITAPQRALRVSRFSLTAPIFAGGKCVAAKTPDSQVAGIAAGGPMTDGDSTLSIDKCRHQGLKHIRCNFFASGGGVGNGDTYDTGLESIVEVAFSWGSQIACSVTHSAGVLTFHVPGDDVNGSVHVWHKGY